jgi:hypothetical protein
VILLVVPTRPAGTQVPPLPPKAWSAQKRYTQHPSSQVKQPTPTTDSFSWHKHALCKDAAPQ